MTQEKQDLTVAKEIMRQLGNKMFVMIGAHDIFATEGRGLMLKFKGSKQYNFMEVILDPDDTYTVKFKKIWGLKITREEEFNGIYCDMLHDLFERKTGLYTHL